MPRRINVLILAAAFMVGLLGHDDLRMIRFGIELLSLTLVPIVTFALLPMFAGTMCGIFGGGRTFVRPTLSRFPLGRGSPLQFLWFGGLVFVAVGLGVMLRWFSVGIPESGLVVLSAGVGLIIGAKLVISIFPHRFPRESESRTRRV